MIKKAGFISVLGRPNVGKSTLLEAILKEKISIISDKPQTTREKIKIIQLYRDSQMIFLDTPGIQKPKNKLGVFMEDETVSSIGESDLVLWVVDESEYIGKWDKHIAQLLSEKTIPVILVINKSDLIKDIEKVKQCYEGLSFIQEICIISARKAHNVEALLETIYEKLPAHPGYYPEDMITDKTERFIVAEFIREKALMYLEDEIPHGIAVEVQKMRQRESGGIYDIEAVIYCERDAHKGIVIGKNGRKLKGIGKQARLEIEKFLSQKVNLQLWVKVNKNWREKELLIKKMGYHQ